jgi:hypothetical protein
MREISIGFGIFSMKEKHRYYRHDITPNGSRQEKLYED